jgi:Mlo family
MDAVSDIKHLFWLGRPDLVMLLTHFVYFNNSMSICLILFTFKIRAVDDWIFEDLKRTVSENEE